MIQAIFLRDHKELIQSVEISGHANFSEYGEDIVCAAVSSQAISVENSLQQLLEIPMLTEVDDVDGGYLKIELPPVTDQELMQQAQLLLEHLYLALTIIAENYEDYLMVKEIQVNG